MLCHLPQKNCLKELLIFYFPSSPNKDVKEVGLYSPFSHSAFDTDQSTFSSLFSPKQQKGTCFESPIDFPTVKLLPPSPTTFSRICLQVLAGAAWATRTQMPLAGNLWCRNPMWYLQYGIRGVMQRGQSRNCSEKQVTWSLLRNHWSPRVIY